MESGELFSVTKPYISKFMTRNMARNHFLITPQCDRWHINGRAVMCDHKGGSHGMTVGRLMLSTLFMVILVTLRFPGGIITERHHCVFQLLCGCFVCLVSDVDVSACVCVCVSVCVRVCVCVCVCVCVSRTLKCRGGDFFLFCPRRQLLLGLHGNGGSRNSGV